MSVQVSGLYAALFALLFLVLSMRVVGVRKRARVSIGAGEDADLARRIRVHGNAAEYGPLILLLMALCEMQAVSVYVIHAIGIALLVGRLLHWRGMAAGDRNLNFRVAGMVLTFACLLVPAVILLARALGL